MNYHLVTEVFLKNGIIPSSWISDSADRGKHKVTGWKIPEKTKYLQFVSAGFFSVSQFCQWEHAVLIYRETRPQPFEADYATSNSWAFINNLQAACAETNNGVHFILLKTNRLYATAAYEQFLNLIYYM